MEDLQQKLSEARSELERARERISDLEAQAASISSSDIMLERILRRIPDLGWGTFALVDSRGTVRYVNKPATDIMGYSPAEFSALGILDLVHPDDLPLATSMFAELISSPGAVRSAEVRARHKDGHWLWHELTAINLLDDPDFHAVLVNSRENHVRKTADERLKFLYQILDATNGANDPDRTLQTFVSMVCQQNHWSYGEVWLPDAEGYLTVSREAFYVAPGYSDKIALFRSGTELIRIEPTIGIPGQAWQSRSMNWIPDVQGLSHGDFPRHIVACEAGLHTALVIPVSDRDGIVAVMVFFSNEILERDEEFIRLVSMAVGPLTAVIRRKQSFEALSYSEELYRTLVQTVDAFVSVVDADSRILFSNELAWRALGLPPEARQGKTMSDLFPPENIISFNAVVKKVFESGKALTATSQVQIAGKRRWLQNTVAPLRSLDGSLTRVMVTGIDVTQMKEDEQALQRAAARLTCTTAIDRIILTTGSLEELAESSLEQIMRIIPYDRAAISMIDLAEATVRPLALYVKGTTGLPAGRLYSIHDLDTSVLGHAPYVIITDLEHHVSNAIRQLYAEGIRAMAIIALKVQGIPVAVFNLHSTRADFFTDEYVQVALEIADHLTIGLLSMQRNEAVKKHAAQLETRVAQRTAELERATRRTEVVVSGSSEGILLINVEGGIQNVNPAFVAMFAASPESFLGVSLRKLIHPGDVPRLEAAVHEVITNGVIQRLDARAIRHDGSMFEAELGLSPVNLQDSEGRQIVCIIRDITARKAAQQQIAEERNLLRTLVDAVPDLIFIKDTEHRTVFTNLARAHAFGCDSPDELVGKSDEDLMGKDLSAGFTRDEEEIFRTGQPLIDHEELFQSRDRGLRWLSTTKIPLRNMEGKLVGLVGINRDISERKERERQLHYFASLQESVSDAVIATDLDFHIRSWNHAAEVIYGWPAAEAIGKLIEDVAPLIADADERTVARDALLLAGNVDRLFRQKRRDGGEVTVQASVTLLKDDHGTPVGIVAVNRDVTEQQRAQLALELYSREVDDLYNNAPCGYHSLDKDGIIELMNDTELRWLGYSRDEVISRLRFTDLLSPESRQRFQSSFPRFKASGVLQDLEMDLVRKDGSQFTVLVNAIAIYGPHGEFQRSRTSVFDITELKRTQRALTESEALYRLLAENMTDMIMRRGHAGNIVYLSQSCRALTGYDPEELIGTQLMKMIHPDDIPALHKTLLSAQSGEVSEVTGSFRLSKKDGLYIWVEAMGRAVKSGDSIEFIASLRNITLRKEAEEALRSSEARFRQLIETMRGGIVVYGLDKRITYVNDRFCELIGVQRNDVLGTLQGDFIAGHDTGKLNSQNTYAQQNKSYELAVTHANGQQYHLLVAASPLYDAHGSAEGGLAIVTDISAQKQAEHALRQALAKEQELGELKSRFVTVASHEFRTPLAVILAATETIAAYRQKLTDEQIDARLQKINQQVAVMKRIMDDVLELANIQSGRVEFHPVAGDLDALCREIVVEFVASNESARRIQYSGPGAPLKADFDPQLMRQVVTNLISNALKYSPEPNPVTFSLSTDQTDITLIVKDEGIGIPEEDITHLFKPFHRGHNVGTRSGTGLGMSITRQAIELHSGTIAVQSKVNRGTQFTVTIPHKN